MSNCSPIIPQPIVIVSKLFAVFPFDSNIEKVNVHIFYTCVTLFLCLIYLYLGPNTVTIIDKKSEYDGEVSYSHFLKILFPSTIFSASLASKVTSLFFLKNNLKRYADCLRFIDTNAAMFSPKDVRKRYLFSSVTLLFILLLTIPVNLARLRLFYIFIKDWKVLLLFGNMYFQNISVALQELQFVNLTYTLTLRMHKVNFTLKALTKKKTGYLQQKYRHLLNDPFADHLVIVDRSAMHSMFAYNLVEFSNIVRSNDLCDLRKTYKHVCEAVEALQNAYGIFLIFSICALNLMLLLDIYFEVYGHIGGSNTKPWEFGTYIWIAQYSLRFGLVVQVTQKLSNEGVKTRYLISCLNNRFLDSETKEELSLFINHVSNMKIEFTACQFFTLNTRLITSAIAAGTTYLVILVQFHTEKDS